jgi:hypothetical protein
VTLRILKSGLVGTNPFSTHGALFADFLKFYAGEATATNRPVLVVEYILP